LPAGWAGSQYGRHEPISYIRVRPELVVEVAVDVAVERGRWRHPVRYMRPRPDLAPADIPRGLEVDGG
jgi:hypothetical protein